MIYNLFVIKKGVDWNDENGYFRLQPENDTMDPIILDEVTILGKAIGLYRKF